MIADIFFERNNKKSKNFWRIPMINVIFLLLVYVVIGGTMNGFEVLHINVPVAESTQELNQGHVMIILGKHDEVLVDDELVSAEEVDEKLAAEIRKYPDMLISVKADADLAAPKLIAMLERIKKAGGKNLTLATQKP